MCSVVQQPFCYNSELVRFRLLRDAFFVARGFGSTKWIMFASYARAAWLVFWCFFFGGGSNPSIKLSGSITFRSLVLSSATLCMINKRFSSRCFVAVPDDSIRAACYRNSQVLYGRSHSDDCQVNSTTAMLSRRRQLIIKVCTNLSGL